MTTHPSLSMHLGSVVTPRTPWLAPFPSTPVPDGLVERLIEAIRARGYDLAPTQSLASATTRRSKTSAQPADHAGTQSSAASDSSSREPSDEPDATSDPAQPAISMEQMVRDHADAVYRVALSITKDPVLAEDVSQDVLIKAWQSLPSYRGEAPLRHWILRITHNVSISTLRRRREDVVAPADFPEQATTDRAVDIQVQDRLAIARFEAALGDLDGVSRSIVVLREVEGMSYGEMSDALELPLPTIRTRLLRARRQLADALDGWQP